MFPSLLSSIASHRDQEYFFLFVFILQTYKVFYILSHFLLDSCFRFVCVDHFLLLLLFSPFKLFKSGEMLDKIAWNNSAALAKSQRVLEHKNESRSTKMIRTDKNDR